jgi:hypothetical protein
MGNAWCLVAVSRCGGQFFNGFFGTWDQATNLTSHSKSTKYKTVIKLLVAATVGCQGAKTEFLRLFASESTTNTPRTHCALQHTAGTTPLSGTPCEFTGRVWEVAYCSGKPKWAQDTAKTEVSSRNVTWTQLGGTSVGRGVPSWLVLVGGVFGKSVGAGWGLSGASKGLRAANFCV